MNITASKYTLWMRDITLNPWAAFYFLQSVLINYSFGYSFSLLYSVAFCCVLFVLWRFAPRVQKGVILLCSLLAAMYYPFQQAYGAPNFNTLLALHATNVNESVEILTIFPWHSYLVSSVILALGGVALARKIGPKQPWRRLDMLCLAFSVACFFMTPAKNLVYWGNFTLLDVGYPVFRFVKDVVINNQEVVQEKAHMLELAKMKDNWTVLAVKPRYHNYVMVIGESARRDALGAFGGQWNNTPFASAVNGTLFTDFISASASTQTSLGHSLSRVSGGSPEYQNNVVTLANRAGFRTWWFSNQGQIGEYDTAIASIAKRADEVQFLRKGYYEDENNPRDEALLQMTQQVLSAPRTEPRLIVLHLMGSHPQACERTQGKYLEFVQSKETSCYIYSITQTDTLLKKLYEQLQNSGDSFSMVYFSDHGLTYKARLTGGQYMAHGDAFQQNYQVPLMIMSSDDKAHRLIKARRSANDFLDFFSVWTGIEAKEITPKYPFVSEQDAGTPWVMNFKLQKVDYAQLPDDLH
ncbi:phosphoethanolamine transferase [Leclercia sp.]|uniref:phosphoethanolamine transferase n=1 Tax=Leclercia sp. TaxID=1898428 RepID=UPI0028AC19E8|nr:sulfatase-like hydrolase/transferase [Leclercia sp.]